MERPGATSPAEAVIDGPAAGVTYQVVPAQTVTSSRGSLDRRKILEAAVQLIDDEGLRGFTMRSLGSRLGVEAMALYRYVYGREALLDGIVEHVIDDLYTDPDVQFTAPHWEDYLARLAHAVRRIALTHPEVFPLIATRPPAAPWLRPPLRSLRWMETFLGTLRECGFSDEAAVSAYRGFSSFLLGHLLLEVSALGADTAPIEQAEPEPATSADLTGYPLLQRLEPMLSQNRSAEEFEKSLESLLDRLEAQL
ncbi:TetR/AcrR family transcriptional regulator C-terminal domain-containing protein [Nakamurella deserti]|uniref:TetR/AcrR family transcriptional regulator C-terminal domain-containing protein n=1 Tax=Nakamurella deserti TaxID=2164074 RepID=UPI003B8313FD